MYSTLEKSPDVDAEQCDHKELKRPPRQFDCGCLVKCWQDGNCVLILLSSHILPLSYSPLCLKTSPLSWSLCVSFFCVPLHSSSPPLSDGLTSEVPISCVSVETATPALLIGRVWQENKPQALSVCRSMAFAQSKKMTDSVYMVHKYNAGLWESYTQFLFSNLETVPLGGDTVSP